MATHSSILAWRIPMDRGVCGLQSMGFQRVDKTDQLSTAQHRRVQRPSDIGMLEWICQLIATHSPWEGPGDISFINALRKKFVRKSQHP